MTLGRKYFSITRTDGGADVFRLAGFLRDDDLIGHDGLGLKDRFDAAEREHTANKAASQAANDRSGDAPHGQAPSAVVSKWWEGTAGRTWTDIGAEEHRPRASPIPSFSQG